MLETTRDALTDKLVIMMGLNPERFASTEGRSQSRDFYGRLQRKLRKAVEQGADPDTLTVDKQSDSWRAKMKASVDED